MSEMHILLTVNTTWNVVNFRKSLVRSMLDEGHRVTILAPPDKSVLDVEAMGCRFLPLDLSAKGMSPIEGLQLIQRFRGVFQVEKPDIVFGYTIKNNIFGALAARLCNIPFVPNVTGLGTAFLSGSLLERVATLLYRTAFARLPVVFFQNADDRDLFLDRGLVREEQVRLLPGSGVDLTHFTAMPYPPEGEAPTFLMIARLLRDKGVMEYVEAAREIRKRHPQVRFQLLGAVGADNRTAISQTELDAWVQEGVIDYCGTTEDVRPYIAAAHCVVLPSYREGAPRTLIEAAAMARPLITTDVPGCRAVVEAGYTGLLCEVRSGPSLAAACQRFLALPYLDQIALGQAGRAKMNSEYDQSLVISAYREALSDVTRPSHSTVNLPSRQISP